MVDLRKISENSNKISIGLKLFTCFVSPLFSSYTHFCSIRSADLRALDIAMFDVSKSFAKI